MAFKIEAEKKQILELIKNHEYISFDIFDTAILREVFRPEDVFLWVEEELKHENQVIPNFRSLRLQAERLARKRCNAEDVTFDQIYDSFPIKYSKKIIEKAKSLELIAECMLTIANPFMLEIYNLAKTLGKRVFFISDMYHSAGFLGRLLKQKGFDGFEALFVSSETGVSKASSNMYAHVINQMGITNPSQWLHIGDNLISDIKNAEKFGIHTYYYEKLNDRIRCFSNTEVLGNSILQASLINRYETSDYDYWKRFGAYFTFPIVYAFVNWLIEECQGADKIYFLSRDGYFPYLVYNKYREMFPELPEPVYLHASRRVFQIPSLSIVSRNEALEILTACNFALGQKITIGEILNSIGLPTDEQAMEAIRSHGFQCFSDYISNEQERSRAKGVLTALYDRVQSLLETERKIILRYLEQNGIDANTREIHVVDIGWRGSTQRAIQLLTGIKTKGYYFGTEANVYSEISESVKSFAFHLGRPFSLARKIMSNVMMFEFIFSAPHGSAVKIVEEDRGFRPILKEVENNEYYFALKKIEAGIIEMLDLCVNKLVAINFDRIKVIDNYLSFIKEKKYEDLLQFSQLKSVVGIGDTKTMQPFVTVVSLNEFKKNEKKILASSKKNLWMNAVLIRDSADETSKINSIKIDALQEIRRIVTLERIGRAIRNPSKAIRYLVQVIRK